MRRNERERIARRNEYRALRESNTWMPKGLSLAEYLKAIEAHDPIPQMLDFLSRNHREWSDTDFDYNKAGDGTCEKCSTRALNIAPTGEMKSSGTSGFDGEDIQYSKFIAEKFAEGKEPITLTPELHREFICQSWIEATHLEHITEHMREPGIAAIEAQPEVTDGKVTGLLISFRVIDGSHRAALTYREGHPFSARILSPVENLKSIFAIGTKKNPFFALRYSPELEEALRMMAGASWAPM
jgi:hypothetical protein